MRLCLLLALIAAVPAAGQPSPEGTPYWILVTATVPADAPTPRALARRAVRGVPEAPADRSLAPDARAALAHLGVDIRVESGWLGAVSAVLTDAQREAVAALPFVREVRPVGRLVGADVTAPLAEVAARPQSLVLLEYGPSATQLSLVDADAAIEAGYTGAGVRIGFLDTLFDFGHPALADIASSGRLIGVQDFTDGQTQSSFHGLSTTSVALGHADGALIGPAFGAEVLAGTTEYAPTETHAEEDALVAGLEWLEINGADVVSISLGYSTFDAGEGDYTYADLDGNTALVTRAVDRAVARGLVVVVSAGNEGASAWHFITAPADADSAITVGAVSSSGARASFSSVGPTADGRIKPDVAALGVSVYVAQPGGGYGFSNGTSFSAPMVAGIATQILQARPDLTPIQVRQVLRSTASRASAPDNTLGWGVVDAMAAITAATALPTATDLEPLADSWRLYPSAVRSGGRVVVETPAVERLDVFDVAGRRVAQLDGGSGRRVLTLPALPAGLYLVRPVGEGSLPALRLAVVR